MELNNMSKKNMSKIIVKTWNAKNGIKSKYQTQNEMSKMTLLTRNTLIS